MTEAPRLAAPTSASEAQAVAAARALIAERGREARHHVAAGIVTAAGRTVTGLNLESALGRSSVCAEAVAVGMAAVEDARLEVVFSVAVNRRGLVIPPCGLCRELLTDFGPRARVAVPGGADYAVMTLAELLPCAYKAAERGAG